MTVQVSVVQGDITTIQSDALITCIDSAGTWYGGVNTAIDKLAGGVFHHQAYAELPLADGEVLVARGEELGLPFRNVVFIVDELATPLSELVLAALKMASSQHFARVTLPLLRTGSTKGLFEVSVGEAIEQVASGIRHYTHRIFPRHVVEIIVVVYDNPAWAMHAERVILAGED